MEENEFETFVKENFKDIPAVMSSRTREHLSTAYGAMMIHAESCDVTKAIRNFAHFNGLVGTIEGEAVSYYRHGLVTQSEMMFIISKFEDFVLDAIPEYLTEILASKCGCKV